MIFFFKDIFSFGLSEPVKSWLPEGKFNVSLKDFMDYTLMVAGSSFTVGVVEEHDTASVTEMADAPERMHKMATTATGHIITAIHESGKVTASHCEPNIITSPLICQSLVTSPLICQSLVTAPLFIQSLFSSQLRHIIAGHPESRHITAGHPETCHILSVTPRYSTSVLRVHSLVSSVRELTESAPEPAPSQELTQSAPEPDLSQELTQSAPEPAPSQELTQSAPEPAPS